MRIGYDVESYINYFCVGLENYEDGEKLFFEISEERNDLTDIYNYFSNYSGELVSFNGIYYDNFMIKFILSNYHKLKDIYYGNITAELKHFSDKIIMSDSDRDVQRLRWYKTNWTDIDLFLYWSKDLRLSKKISLKSLGIQLGYPVTQELPFEPNAVLTAENLPSIREYNLVHDLGILRLLHDNMLKDIQLREYIRDTLKIPCMSMDAPKIASEVLLYDYCANHNYNVNEVRKWTYDRPYTIPLRKVLTGFDPQYETKVFQDMFQRWLESYDTVSDEFIFNEGLTELTLTYGIGGLHSVNENEKYYSNDTHIVKTSDVASLYPNLIINYKCIRFPEVLKKYKEVKDERIIAKRTGEKSKDALFKLILNSISGMLDNKYSWLYFPEGALRMRLIGQLILTKFIEKCALSGWKVVSANT